MSAASGFSRTSPSISPTRIQSPAAMLLLHLESHAPHDVSQRVLEAKADDQRHHGAGGHDPGQVHFMVSQQHQRRHDVRDGQ